MKISLQWIFYHKANEDFMSAGPLYDKGGTDITSMTSIRGTIRHGQKN